MTSIMKFYLLFFLYFSLCVNAKEAERDSTSSKCKVYTCKLAAIREKKDYSWGEWSEWQECDCILTLIPNTRIIIKARIENKVLANLKINKLLEHKKINSKEYSLRLLCSGELMEEYISEECIVRLRQYNSKSQIYIDLNEGGKGISIVFPLNEITN